VAKSAAKAPSAQTGNIIDLLKRSMELEQKRGGKKVKAPSIAAALPKGKAKQRARRRNRQACWSVSALHSHESAQSPRDRSGFTKSSMTDSAS
jgi:hypothetical protein